MSKSAFNPNGPTVLRCDKCGNLFSTALKHRSTCVKCKKVTKEELAELMAAGGVTFDLVKKGRR